MSNMRCKVAVSTQSRCMLISNSPTLFVCVSLLFHTISLCSANSNLDQKRSSILNCPVSCAISRPICHINRTVGVDRSVAGDVVIASKAFRHLFFVPARICASMQSHLHCGPVSTFGDCIFKENKVTKD